MDMFGGFSSQLNQMNQMSQGPIYNQEIHAVHGYEGAKEVRVLAGGAVILPDDTDKLVWWISADKYGVKTIVAYPIGDPIQPTQSQQPQQQTSAESPIYVQQKEFDELKTQVDKLAKFMEEFK